MVPTQETFQWQFEPVGKDGMENELEWTSSIQTSGQQLILFNENDLTLIDMLATDHYQFVQSKESRFTIYFGKDAESNIRPPELKMTCPFPNPLLSERTTSFTIGIPDKTQDAEMNIMFLNSAGTMIKNGRETLSPGVHELKYGLNQDQPSGVYFYRVAIDQGNVSKVFTGKIVIP
jgi:hypothetical protein